MKVIFRVDASIWIGSGHVMRCLVLADALKNVAADVSFACLPQHGDMIAYIEQRGHSVTKMTPVLSPVTPVDDADYLGWLQRSVDEDASDFISKIQQAEIVVTDHYAIGREWQQRIKAALQCKIVAIDDLVRQHDADCIIDQTLGRKAEEYFNNTTILAGTDYALLAESFSHYRAIAISKSSPKSIPKVLVSMGGVDAPNATLMVLKSLVGKVDASFTVLLSPRAPHYQEVVAWCDRHESVTHVGFCDNMALLMLDHDIAIGAPGSTSWERACLGLPSIIIPLAANQKTIMTQLVNHRAVIALELNEIRQKIINAFQMLLSDWETYHKVNLALCDGKGVKRVMLILQQQAKTIEHCDFELTLATSADIKVVYDWQCHPKTRQYALNTAVPTWDEHLSWMIRKLTCPEDYFYIIRHRLSKQPCGVLRLDKQKDKNYLVSIFVNPEQYGIGVASSALLLADFIHPDVTLHATVLENNQVSQQLFTKAHYLRVSTEQFIRFPIK